MTPYYYSLWGNIAVFDANRYDPSKAAVQNPSTGYIISGDRYNGIVIPGTGWPDAAQGTSGDRRHGRSSTACSAAARTIGATGNG